MALNVVSDNDLINNKKLAFPTFTSRNPTPHPPDKDTGIVDSGSSHFYFAPGAPVMNLRHFRARNWCLRSQRHPSTLHCKW